MHPPAVVIREKYEEDNPLPCHHSAECGDDGWNDISHADGESGNRGGQLPIVVIEDEESVQSDKPERGISTG